MSIAGRRELYFGTEDGKTFNFQQDVFTDNSTPIASRIKTKEYYLSGPDQIDEIQRIFAYSEEPQGGTISLSIDGGEYEVLGSMQEADNPERFDVFLDCYHLSLGIDEISSNNFKVKGFNVIYEPKQQII